MENKNDTVYEIVGEMRNEGYYRGFMGITNPLTDRMVSHLLDRIEAAYKREVAELRRRLKVVVEICEREISFRQKIAARCEMCREDFSAGEDCPYCGEPRGCNSPTYGKFPSEIECEPFVEILAVIREEGEKK